MPFSKYFLFIFCILSFIAIEIRGQGCNGPVTATVNPKEYCFEGNPISVTLNGNIIGKSCEFFWTPDGNLDNPNSLKPTATIDAAGMYMYTLYGIIKNPVGGNLIVNGSFESGNTGFTSEYSYVAPVFNALQPEGIYTITNPGQTAASVHSDFSACQPQAGARYMVINGTSGSDVKVWCQTVPVSANTGYLLSAWATSVHPSNPAILQFSINGELLGNNFGLSGSTCAWQNFFECWYSKTATSADICIVNQNLSLSGNDFAIDNITFTKAQTDSCKVSFKVVEPVQKSKIATICKGETYKLGTSTFTDPGYYTDIRVKGTGPCDTIYSLDLNVIEINSTILDTVGLDCNQKQMKLNAYSFVNNNQNQFLTYKWTASGGGNIVSGDLTLNPLINKGGKYTFVTTYKVGNVTCRDTNSITITNDTIKPKVNILPALDTINCQKNVINLVATSSILPPLATIQWTLLQNAHFISGDTTLKPIADSAGIYILTVKNLKNGCVGIDTSKVFKNLAIPVFGIAPADTLSCSKDSILLTGNLVDYSKYTYLWKTQNGILDKDTDKHATWVKSAGKYTLYVRNIFNKCVDSVSIEVLSDTDVPVAFVDAPLPLNCFRNQVTLDGTKSTNNANILFSWQTLNGNIVSGGNTKTPIVDKEGEYKLSVLNTSNGCNKAYTVTVGWDTTKPLVQIAQPLELSCVVTEVELDGSASATGKELFQWTTFDGKLAGNTTLPKATAQSVGTYFLEVTDTLNGCKSKLPITVKNDTTKPKSIIAAADTLNCLVNQIDLNGNGSSKGARYLYNWVALSGNIVQGTNSLLPKIDQKGTYQLVVHDTILGCKDSSTITVVQDIQKPIATIDLPKVINCRDTVVQIFGTNSTASSNSLKFQWYSATKGKLTDSLSSIKVTNADTIQLIVQDLKNGCFDTTSTPVIKDVLVPNATVDTDVLLTCKFGKKALNSAITSGKGPFGYSWSTMNGTIETSTTADSIIVSKDGTYILAVVDSSNYCSATFSSKVTKDVQPPTVQIAPATVLNCRDTLSFLNATASSTGPEYVYKWSAQNGSLQGPIDSTKATASQPGDYLLVVTNVKNGCIDSATVKVTQDIQSPTVQIATPLIINCLNKVVSVDGSQSSSGNPFVYNWSTLDGNIVGSTNIPVIAADKPGTYLLEITNTLNFCKAQQSILVTKSADVPIAAIAKTDTLTCGITTVAIDGSGSTTGGNFSLNWSTAGGVIQGNPSSAVVATSKAGTYTLIVTNTQNNCKDTANITVPQNIQKPTAVAAALDTINCRKSLVAIDGTKSTGTVLAYFWSTINGNLTSNNVPKPSVTKAGLYTLVVEDQTNNCKDTSQVTVLDDFAKPLLLVNQPDTLSCKTKNATVSTTANANYSFLWSGNGIVSGQNSSSIVVDKSGTYLVQAILARNGCSDSAKVVVLENFVVPISNIQPVAVLNCSVNSVLLDAAGSSIGNVTYLWSTTNGKLNGPTNGATATAAQSGNYQLLVTNQSNGCQSTKSVFVGIDTVKPILSIPTPKEITCIEKTVTLSGNALNTLGYLWTTNDGNILGNPNSKTVTVDKKGTYQLVVTDPTNGCKQQSSTVVVDYINYPYADAGPDFSLNCKTNKATLTDLAYNFGNFTYSWKNSGGSQISSKKDASISSTGTFVLTVKNQENGCERSDTVVVNQIKPTGLNLLVKSPECGQERGYIDVTSVIGGTPAYGFLYGNLVIPGGPHIPHLLPGTYSITVVDANQCTYATKATVNSPTGFELKVNNQVSILPGDSVQLHAEVNVPKSRIDTLIWSPANTLNLQDIWNPFATPNGVARYTVMAIDTNNCRDSAEIWINIIHPDVFIPNIFSPNGDGSNDQFFINAKVELILKVNYLEIFDRWGNRIFTVQNFTPNDPQYGWDGTFNNKLLDPGVFVYVTEVEYKDGVRRVFKGDVTLLRD